MKRFSERIGITKPSVIQLEGISTELKNSLWNVVLTILNCYRTESALEEFCNKLAFSFFKIPLDEIRGLGYTAYGPFNRSIVEDWIKEKFYSLEWYRVYEFIEFLVRNEKVFKNIGDNFNYVLERECSGYRLVNDVFVPITNEQEIKEIEEAVKKATQFGIEGSKEHLDTACSLLAKKPSPDYRNSIKESISAIESLVKQMSGVHSGGLESALRELSKKAPIHGALKEGFIKLYGYTSDEGGIRHAILEDSNVGLDEAQFMLVTCSAFVNLLISKAQKAGLLKEG